MGRQEELLQVDRALDSLATGSAGALEVVGAAGIGKTRLLAEIATLADDRGHTVLRGAASDLERDIAFSVFVEALDEYVESVPPRLLANLSDGEQSELAQVLPAFVHERDRDAVRVAGDRFRINRAVRELLELLAVTKPLVLILDDFHWADAASVDLMGSLLRHPPQAPVLTIMGTRPHAGDKRLTATLDRALREHRVSRVQLAPLDADEAAAMLGQPAPDERTRALFEESGGNPFYLEQLARSPELADRLALSAQLSVDGVHVPPLVLAALTEELTLLPKQVRRALEGASVAGDPFELDLAASAADIGEPAALEALDELLARDVIRPTDVPRRFRFRHPIVRRAVYEGAPGGWRIGAHQRAAAALAARGADAGARAHHVEISARVGDASAIATLAEAGTLSAQRAPAIAARWFAGALRLLPGNAPAGERVELLLASATALAATGRFAEAHDAILASLALVPAEATAVRLKLTATCARIEHLIGRHDDAHARLVAALDALPDATGADAISMMQELAADAVFGLDYGAGQAWATRAADASRALGDPLMLAASLALLARALTWEGDAGAGDAVRDEAAQLIDALPDEELARQLDALVDLAAAEIYLDRYAAAGAHAERALRIGRATGQDQLFPGIHAILGVAWTMSGRLEEGAELLDAAIEAGRLSNNPLALAWALFCRAFLALPAGDLGVAMVAAQESLELAAAGVHDDITARSGPVLAMARLYAGESVPGAAHPGVAGTDPFAVLPETWKAYFYELLTRYWLAHGDLETATSSTAAARESAANVGLRLPSAFAARAGAAIDLARGDARAAADATLGAAQLADAVGVPIEAALARVLAGRALAQLDQRDEAIALLEAAVAELDRHGAGRYRDEAQRELRRLGGHIHRRTQAGDHSQTGVASLTARELEIARLIVDRRTNGEIAAELFLSPKTVETHIRNMFRKLDANSRVDVARAVERADRALAGQN